MRTICGCGSSFKRSGLRNHQQRSSDPQCKAAKQNIWASILENIENDSETDGLEIDPNGDFFGDYADYSNEELGLQQLKTTESTPTYQEDSDEDDIGEAEFLAENNGIFLEPERLPPNPTIPMDTGSNADNLAESSGRAARLRGGAEAGLKKKPYVVNFSQGRAGAVYTDKDCTDQNSAYTHQIGNPNNPFSPFSSKIEWEIAHWAKTRGPSSTSFTELMSIEGVSCLERY